MIHLEVPKSTRFYKLHQINVGSVTSGSLSCHPWSYYEEVPEETAWFKVLNVWAYSDEQNEKPLQVSTSLLSPVGQLPKQK